MARKEYKQLSCRDMGHDCDFLLRAETEKELSRLVNEHLCEVHDLCAITPAVTEKMNNSVKGIWCREGQCSHPPFLRVKTKRIKMR